MVDAFRVHIPVLQGRAHETQALRTLLDRAANGDGGVLSMRGDPGTGKTALIDYAVATGRVGGFTVLRTAGIEAEADLPYAALAGLVEPLGHDIEDLPHPQAAALKTLIDGCPPDDRLPLRLGVRNLLAKQHKLLCAVDDTHLLDPESRGVFRF